MAKTATKASTFIKTPAFPPACNRIHPDAMGVELELEFTKPVTFNHLDDMINPVVGRAWKYKQDGSLRGYGYEFISRPRTLEDLKEEIPALYNAFKQLGYVIQHSHRTSSHVHLNFSKNTLKEVYQFLLLYYFFEPTLFCLTEEDRWGNTFCVSSETTGAKIAANANDYEPFWVTFGEVDRAKYASLNLAPYTTFGTLESRIYHGAYNMEELLNWITVLSELKAYAVKAKSVKALYKEIEDTDFKDFIKVVFPTTHKFIFEHVAMRDKKYYELSNLGNAAAFPIVTIEKRLAEATDFFMEEQKKLMELVVKARELEKNIENYLDDLL